MALCWALEVATEVEIKLALSRPVVKIAPAVRHPHTTEEKLEAACFWKGVRLHG